MTTSDPQHRAWGWVRHLRDGGTTPWVAWDAPAEPTGRVLPGAQQLELLRRANQLVDEAATHHPAGLADRVLGASAAGRGHADLPLVGAGSSAYGPRPVDPATLGARELTRVASVVLAHDLVGLGPDPVPDSPAVPWRRRQRLVGDPVLVHQHRAELAARGRPQGGARPYVVVAAGPLDQLLAHTWTQRCFEHGTRPWPDWLRFWRERDQLPARVDLADSVRRWDGRRPLVRIVTDLDRLPRQLGVRRLAPVVVPGADQAELARRIAAVVGLLVPADARPDLMRTLQARMPAGVAAPVRVPEASQPWVAASAERMAREIGRAGYPVVGDLADLAPRPAPPGRDGTSVVEEQVLDLATRMLVDPGWRTAGTSATRGVER